MKKLCFLVGSMAISGGTYVIVQHAAYLLDQGYDVTLAVQEPFNADTLAWHDRIMQLHCVPIEDAKREEFDLVIATWWKTALELHHFNAPRYAYFVQSIESYFYPENETPLRSLVDATYELPCSYITEAKWIQEYLETNYAHRVALVRNGIRKDIYQAEGTAVALRDSQHQPRVLVEGHFGVPFKNTALAIRLAREAGAKDIWVLTGSPVKWIPGVSRVFSRVPMSVTSEIYRSCDILVKLSTVEGMFGPPLEIFHCGGTAIVFDVSGHDEYITDGHNACVVKRGDLDGVVTTLRRLLNNRVELTKLQANALQTAESWASWSESSSAFRDWVEVVLSGPVVNRTALAQLVDRAFLEYQQREQQRLSNRSRMSRYHLSRLVVHFSPLLLRFLKQFEAVGEVLFGSRKAR
ncbi:glycosyltransferase [Serratia microhaemolytica]|uniref:glycosyltransferase n=1 Tax=Serratia microhaemolytica TaxID=2675110 RepID=UPI00197E527E|nr:glycosyltransferase [Serratia microhaemolytica]